MGVPAWLTEEQQSHWRSYVEGSARLQEVRDRELRAAHQLSLAEFEILVWLSEAPRRRMRMAELAERAFYSPSRLSHAISRLETRGLVGRCASDDDKRGVYACLTEAGQRKVEQAARDNVEVVRRHFVDLMGPDELRTVGQVFQVVARSIRASAGSPAPSE